MPYTSTPPAWCSASKIVTSWPCRIRSPATVSPAGPAPTTATFLPVGAALGGIKRLPCSRSQSAAKRSSLPMATGSSFFPTIQSFSHWSSCGQTLPHTAGRLLRSFSLRAAPAKSPSAISAMKAGISISTGHPSRHFGFLHCRQRRASSCASSGVYPQGTSAKLCARTAGSCSGIFCRGIFSFIFCSLMFCTFLGTSAGSSRIDVRSSV